MTARSVGCAFSQGVHRHAGGEGGKSARALPIRSMKFLPFLRSNNILEVNGTSASRGGGEGRKSSSPRGAALRPRWGSAGRGGREAPCQLAAG